VAAEEEAPVALTLRREDASAVTPATRPRERPGFLYRASGIYLVRIAFAACIVGVWQAYAYKLPVGIAVTPIRLARATWDLTITHHTIWGPLGSSMESLVLGFAISVAAGIPIGIAMGRWRPIEHVLDPYISFLYSIPHVAFIPVMVFWFGFRLEFRLGYVVISAIFPVIINVMAGVKAIDPELIAAGRSFCASERQILRTIILPATSPYMIAGAKQAFSSSWVGVIVAEVLSTQDGLGGLIRTYSSYFLTADMYVPILYIMVISVLIQAATNQVQARLTPWSETALRARGR
jgi:NitT/TauT family transport system permease protein